MIHDNAGKVFLVLCPHRNIRVLVRGEFSFNICVRNTVAIYYCDLCRTGHNNPRFATISGGVRPARRGTGVDVPRIISISCTGPWAAGGF